MCYFLSALVIKNGEDCEVFSLPESTDSHEDLIAFKGLQDNGRNVFVRIEYLPGVDFTNLNEYTLVLDEYARPDWFTEEAEARVKNRLRAQVERMLVREDRHVLASGCYILIGDIKIDSCLNARIIHAGSAMIEHADYSMIKHANSATIQYANSATIQYACTKY